MSDTPTAEQLANAACLSWIIATATEGVPGADGAVRALRALGELLGATAVNLAGMECLDREGGRQ